MINPTIYITLGDPARITASNCQRALLLFAHFDFTQPRALIPAELDARYQWSPRTAEKLLAQLESLGVLRAVTSGSNRASRSSAARPIRSSPASRSLPSLWTLTDSACWTPRALADQWERDLAARQRAEVVASSL